MKRAKFHSLSLYITTLCNFHCLGCCAGTQEKGSITLKEIAALSHILGKVKDIYITGGEPTLHKKFSLIIFTIRSYLNYEKLTLATNGYNLMKYIGIMSQFDEIRISHYAGKEDNTAIINKFKAAYTGSARIIVQRKTLLQNDSNKTGLCGRDSNGIGSYFKGKIYGCCVAAGMDTGKGNKFDKNWRQSAAVDRLPCKDCIFAK